MTKKFGKLEMYQSLMLEFAKLEERLDKLQKGIDEIKGNKYIPYQSQDPNKPYYKPIQEFWKEATERQFGKEYGTKDSYKEIPCYFDNIPPEDRNKPMSISCPCRKCSPYALSSGSLSDGGLGQIWMNTEYKESGDLNI